MDSRIPKHHFTIGEFSKLTGVPKQTLQFYDKMGIFSPAIRKENGYRYYELEQYDSIDIIYALKEAGLGLSDILSYLENRTPELCLDLLEQESHRIKQKIKTLEKTLVQIEQKKTSTERGLRATLDNTVKFVTLEALHLFTWDFSKTKEEDFMLELIRMVNWCYEHGYYTGYAMGSILSIQNLESQNFAKIQYMFTIIDTPTNHENYRYRPAGLYAVYYHKGNYASIPTVYEKLLADITASGYQICGDSYETGLHDFFTVRDENEYLVEISIPVVLIG